VTGFRAREIARRSVGALTVITLLGTAVAVASGLSWPGTVRAMDDAPPRTAPSPAAHQPTAGPSASPARPSVPTRTIVPTPKTSPNPTQSTSAPVGNPGIAITARPNPDGSFLVSEVITLPEALTEVEVRPASIGDAGVGFKQLRPMASNVELTAGGQTLVVPDGPVTGEVTLRWGAPAQQVQLRYRLSGVSIASAHAKPGRTLAAFGSLLYRMPANLPVTVVVPGKTVLSLTCPQLPLATMACGAGKAPQFRTLQPIPFDRSRVLVQYDRPVRG
jgi:hypothetical protein